MSTTSTDRPLRVIQWTTGNIGRRSLHAIIGRPDMELVGVYAHGADKVGVDAAELSGWPEPTGVQATNDIDALLASQVVTQKGSDIANFTALGELLEAENVRDDIILIDARAEPVGQREVAAGAGGVSGAPAKH